MNDYQTTKELINELLNDSREKNKKRWNIGIFIMVISSMLTVGVIILLFVQSRNNVINGSEKNKENILSEFEKTKEIKNFAFNYINEWEWENSSKYYADSVKIFFLEENFSLPKIENEIKLRKKLYPRTKVIVNKNDIFVNIVNKKSPDLLYAEVFANTIVFDDSLKNHSQNIIYNIKVNKNKKIFYVRQYFGLYGK